MQPDTSVSTISAQGLTLQVDFAWSKFCNIINEKAADGHLTPLYIQHFHLTKPQLRFESAAKKSNIATGVIQSFSIGGKCTIRGREIILKPLKRWKAQYNYLSHALTSKTNPDPVPVSWIAKSGMKTWDFLCVNSVTQEPIAKFGINNWSLKQVGNFHFEKSKGEVTEEVRDEVVVTGITMLYIMMVRMQNPLQLLGAVFAKPGKVEDDGSSAEGTELRERDEGEGKIKRP
ncbi:hypothetical protein EJ02DRAFT_358472 [Clathrospora elynae]|uniref:Uncharacterized protein n=1 Tax=Clathrospora elynae TaxID=706981 RepID=A0A6A5S7T1_9PLEO|nr:hypothetical protein EJ02DRAFT_358472 [Clathrospora elynae]